MNRNLSLYFDFVRFLAAVLVVHSHLRDNGIFPDYISSSMAEFGRVAVIIFFVMSGYVIAYTVEYKNHSLKEYILARATRIYSVAIPVILCAFLIGTLGHYLSQDNYSDFYQLSKPYFYIPLHLAFLGETFVFYEKPFLVVPYWSLSYEVWYYIVFAATFFLRGKTRILITALIILFIGHRLILLLPVWWAGVWLYQFNKRHQLSDRLAPVLFFITLLLLYLFKFSGLPEYLRAFSLDVWPSFLLPLGSADRFLSDYIYCVLILGNFYCAFALRLSWLVKYEKLIRACASYTFTLYLCHMLVIEPYQRHFLTGGSWFDAFVCISLITCFTLLLGELTEKRRYVFKKTLSKLLDTLIKMPFMTKWR